MNKFISLTKIQISDFIGKAQSGMSIKNRRLAYLLQFALVLILAIPAVNFSIMTYEAFAQIKQPELVITTMYVNSVILMFVLGLPFITSVFFYSKDIKFLSALPIREDTIVFSKLCTIYIYMFVINILLIGPSLVVYGINTGISLIFIINSILALLMAPLLPLLISSLLVLSISRYLGNSRRRNLLSIISNVIILVAIIGMQIAISRYMSQPEYVQRLFTEEGSFMKFVGMRFPPSIWLTKMVMGSIIDALLFIGLNLLLIYILQLLARLFFRKALHAYIQDSSTAIGEIYYKKRSRTYQLIKRNILIIFKQPTFLMNTVLTLIVPVILFPVMFFTGELSMDFLNSPQFKEYMPLIFSGLLLSPAIISNISATAIAREGQSFWETKVMPISSAENIKYRIYTSIGFNFLGTLLLLILGSIFLPVTINIIIPALIVAITANLFFSTIDIIINIYRPLLDWTNPTAAVKNNLNVMISLGIRAVIGINCYGLYFIFPELFTNLNLVIWLAAILFFVLYLITRFLLYNHFVKKFEQISL